MRSFIIAASLLGLTLVSHPVQAQDPGAAPERMEAPPLGVPPALRQGLYADLQVGGFFTMNVLGEVLAGRRVSNAQPYVGIGLGYDVTRNLVAGLGFGFGASSGACFDAAGPGLCRGANSFSVILVNGYFGYLHGITHQWYLGAKALGGAALMTPEPVQTTGGGLLMGFNGGMALSTEYHTHLEHFVLGLDVAGTLVMGGGAQFPAIAIYPRLKYVF
jgi:hypothetical protein